MKGSGIDCFSRQRGVSLNRDVNAPDVCGEVRGEETRLVGN